MSDRRRNLAWAVLGLISTLCLGYSALQLAGMSLNLPWLSAALAICCAAVTNTAPGAVFSSFAIPFLGVTLGFSALGLWNVLSMILRTRRFLGRVLPLEVPASPDVMGLVRELNLNGRLRVVSLAQPLAFCHGYLRPCLCISTGLIQSLRPTQLRAVLLHELHHLRHMHPLATLAVESVADTLFFLPIAADLRGLLLARMELAADQSAIRQAGRRSLAGALGRLLDSSPASNFPSDLVLSGLNTTQARLDQLLDDKPLAWRPSLSGVASSAAVLSLACILLLGQVV